MDWVARWRGWLAGPSLRGLRGLLGLPGLYGLLGSRGVRGAARSGDQCLQ